MKKRWVFTFGVGMELGKYYQPVMAETYSEARNKMVEKHGVKWCGQYEQEEFDRLVNKGVFANLKPLERIN